MLNKFLFSLFLIGLILFTACSENISGPTINNDEKAVISKTTSMTKGSATIISVSNNHESNHWEVRVDMPGDGGLVKFEYNVGTNDLRQIKGLTPSFDYEIEPVNELMSYSSVRTIALNEVSGIISEWKVEKDKSDNTWQYEFKVLSSGTEFEVRINAVNGTILRIKS